MKGLWVDFDAKGTNGTVRIAGTIVDILNKEVIPTRDQLLKYFGKDTPETHRADKKDRVVIQKPDGKFWVISQEILNKYSSPI